MTAGLRQPRRTPRPVAIPFGQPTLTARRIAKAAVEELGPSDLGAVVYSSPFSKNGIPQNFTADRQRLLAATPAADLSLSAMASGDGTPPL